MTPLEALQKAIEVAGSQSALAPKIGVKQQTISHWVNALKRAPGENVPAIEAATGVSRHDLRPDLWPREQPENFQKGDGGCVAA